MSTMKNILRILLISVCFAFITKNDAGISWITNYQEALQQAEAENKKVLIKFTGSDWCSDCKRLDQEILSQQAFIEYAKTNFVCIEVDFPMKKGDLDADIVEQNKILHRKFNIRKFPSVCIITPEEEILIKTTYEKQSVKKIH